MAVTTTLIIPDFDKVVLTQEQSGQEQIVTNTYSLKGNTVFVTKSFVKKMPDDSNAIYKVERTDYTQ